MRTKFVSAMVIAMAAGGVAPQVGMAQFNNTEARAMARKLDPVRMARVSRNANGQVVRTSEWVRYARPAVGTDIQMDPAFDCYEADNFDPVSGGNPTGFCTSGCTQLNFCPAPAGPSSRWWGGGTYNNPLTINDMTVATGFAGDQSTRALIAWNWGPTVATQCFVAIFTSEGFEACGAATPTTGDYDGIILDFGPQAGGAGYFTSDVDLSIDPTLFWQLPMDGSGAYIYVLANAEDPVTGALTIDTTPGTQCMLWGTGEDETPPDGRAGTQGLQQFDDDFPTDAVIDTTNECYDLTAVANQCPAQLGNMILFFGEGGGPAPCYANCDNSTIAPVLNVADFTCFLQRFAAGCP